MTEGKKELPKVYIGGSKHPSSDDLIYMWAVSEDGKLLAGHVCSDRAWGRHDLHDSSSRHQVYIDKFGGYGDGVFYQIVEVNTWADVPQETREANNPAEAEEDTYGHG